MPDLFCNSLAWLQEQLKVLLKEDTFNPFLTYACFYCFYHVSSTITYVFRNHMRKLKKNERNYLFYFKTLFFFMSKWKDQFAKRYWWFEVWRSEQGKTIYTSNHISKNCRLLYIPKKIYCSGLFLFLLLSLFFLLCFYEKGFGWF